MKTHCKKSNRNAASVLLITMGICAILGILMASYLSMAQTQRFSVARAQAWNSALVVAEAGVEEAMADLNNTNFLKQGAFYNLGAGMAPNKWFWLGGGVICKTNIYLSNNSYYDVFVYSQANPAAPMADSKH